MRTGDSKEGLDAEWCSEASRSRLRHPYTVYRRRGEAWRLPGQVEHEELPEGAKEAFHELAFGHLEQHNTEYLSFEIGRFERASHYWDQRRLPTPLATFLRSKAWVAAGTHEEPGFRGPSKCWAARTRQRRPPRFVHRVPDTVAGLVENSKELADLVFGAALGLRDWHSPETAAERLQVLAAATRALAMHDRLVFRREYRRAWLEVSDAGGVLPAGLELAVSRDGRLEILNGDTTKPATVILAQSAQRSEARILDSAGYPWLDIGDAPAEKVAEQLEATGRFAPRRLGGTDVQLLVDGERFVPTMNDPLLTSLGMGWLPEIVLLGHEMLAEQLERGVQPATVDRRVRAIRVRHCQTITLVVDEQDTSPRDGLEWYGFDDEALPTLILSDRVALTWTTLGKDLARTVSRLIDRRFRFLEALLPQLALGQRNGVLDPPSDEALAKALRCDAQTLLEHRDALRTDVGRVLHLLTPVVAFFGEVALAQELQAEAERAGPGWDLRAWLRARFPDQLAVEEWLDTCERSSDRAEVRKSLELDYERFNRTLLALDEPPLSNAAELRSLYAAYLRQMAPAILERLRRHHAPDFRGERDLGVYVERKTLAFLTFDTAWIQTKETLEQGTVETHVAGLLGEVLGEDRDVDLPPLRRLQDTNRKSVRNFASRAGAVVIVWCRRNGVPVQEPWLSEEPQSVVRWLENAGLLDFELVSDAQLPGLCLRAACWPDAMPQTLDPATLGLDQTAVEEEERRRETKRQGRIVEERSIDFAGNSLDTGDPSFAQAFGRLAEDWIDGNDEWFERSRRPGLAKFAEPPGGSRWPVDGTRRVAGRRKRPSEDLRRAMGLASEWLAFRYLRRHHGEAVDETCWISTNRTRFFGGDEGDDAAGYDFCVNTPQAEWLYEVKSSLENTGEFELTPNEMRVAARVPPHGRRRYRILYVPFVFCPDRWMVLELPNPMGDGTRNRFQQIGQGSVRFRFQHPTIEGGC